MCDFGEPGEPHVQLSQCPHGTIHLTVNHTTLHLSPKELTLLFEKLRQRIKVEDDSPPDRQHRPRHFNPRMN